MERDPVAASLLHRTTLLLYQPDYISHGKKYLQARAQVTPLHPDYRGGRETNDSTRDLDGKFPGRGKAMHQ